MEPDGSPVTARLGPGGAAARRPASLPARLHPRSLRGSLARLDARQRAAAAAAGRALVGSRLLVWGAGAGAYLLWGAIRHSRTYDPAGLTSALGAVGDVLAAPAARWDAAWYLSIAHGGYGSHLGGAAGGDGGTAFFPLYPLLVRGVAALGPGLVLAGVLVSVVALFAALYLIYRLAELELGSVPDAPRLAVLATAVFPMAFFFSAVYSEALYLALSAGLFWLARNGRWRSACLLGGLAAATRSTGVLLALPVALLYLYGPRPDRAAVARGGRLRPRYAPRRDALWIGLIPAGLGAYLGYLALAGGDPMAPFAAQQTWFRHFAGPFGGAWDGLVAAWDGARQLLSGSRAHVYFTAAGGDPIVAAQHNVLLFAFLLAAIPAVVGVARRLPLAYAAYVVAALALPLSYPVTPEPLMSLPRFEAVLFPLHLWAGYALARHPRIRIPALAGSAVALAFFTAEFATWHWVA